jgi:hypothetical protein
MPELENNTERALVACSVWLHIGFIGAVALAAGLLQLFDGKATWLSALALAFSGGLLAAAGGRRGWSVLKHAGRERPSHGCTELSRRRAPLPGTGRGTIAMLSPISLQSNRSRDDDLRHSALQ